MAGFTLIELLIALTLAALLAATSYRAVALLVASHDRVAESSRRWRDIALFSAASKATFSRRLYALNARRIRVACGHLLPGAHADPVSGRGWRGGNCPLRAGERHPGPPGGIPWQRTPAKCRSVLSGVRSVRWEFLGLSDDWSDRWPNSGGMVLLPRALRVTPRGGRIGSLVRIFLPADP